MFANDVEGFDDRRRSQLSTPWSGANDVLGHVQGLGVRARATAERLSAVELGSVRKPAPTSRAWKQGRRLGNGDQHDQAARRRSGGRIGAGAISRSAGIMDSGSRSRRSEKGACRSGYDCGGKKNQARDVARDTSSSTRSVSSWRSSSIPRRAFREYARDGAKLMHWLAGLANTDSTAPAEADHEVPGTGRRA